MAILENPEIVALKREVADLKLEIETLKSDIRQVAGDTDAALRRLKKRLSALEKPEA